MKQCMVSIIVLLGLGLLPVISPGEETVGLDVPWETYQDKEFCMIIPSGCRDMTPMIQEMYPQFKMYLNGDGLLVPMFDETGEALQIGLTVEKFPDTKKTLEQRVERQKQIAREDPRLAIIGEEMIESVTLADGTIAVLLIAEFIKEESRRSVQMKLLLNDQQGVGWVIGGFVVGGKESYVPQKDGELPQGIKRYMLSFCFSCEHIDETPFPVTRKTP